MDDVCLAMFSIVLAKPAHVLVSEAHVVEMVLHNSEESALSTLVIDVVGFEVFVSVII